MEITKVLSDGEVGQQPNDAARKFQSESKLLQQNLLQNRVTTLYSLPWFYLINIILQRKRITYLGNNNLKSQFHHNPMTFHQKPPTPSQIIRLTTEMMKP